MSHNQQIGRSGQDIARKFLLERGYEILAENYFTRSGEVDLIAKQNEQLVFAEVKTRLSEKYGLPEEAVTAEKKAKMLEAAWQYLAEKNLNTDNFRLDCLAVIIDQYKKQATIRHHKNIS